MPPAEFLPTTPAWLGLLAVPRTPSPSVLSKAAPFPPRPGPGAKSLTPLTALAALPALALAQHPTLPVLVVAAFLAGVAIEQFGVAWDVSLQQHVPPDRLARVYSYDMLGSFLAIPVGQVAVGPLAGHIGIRPALLGCAAVILVASCLALSTSSVRGLHTREGAATPTGEDAGSRR